jgi:hypothetical protein
MLQSVHFCEKGGVGSLIFLPQDVLELLSSWRPCKRRVTEFPMEGRRAKRLTEMDQVPRARKNYFLI